jgi:DNA-binding MarR family transcriptional regulator
MKDIEPLPGSKGDRDGGGAENGKPDYVKSPWDNKPTFRFWCLISREFDELHKRHRITKTEKAIMAHVSRREGDELGCVAGLKSIARFTGTHPRWARYCIDRLVRIGLLERDRRAGRTNVLRLCDKLEWMIKAGAEWKPGAPPPPPEESPHDARRRILWAELRDIIPEAKWRPFEQMMNKDIGVFENVLRELRDRVKRSTDPRIKESPDGATPIGNMTGFFVDLFGRWLKDKESR